jgi:hypothetical protein
MDFPKELRLLPDDFIYIFGTAEAVARYHEELPTFRL